MKYGGPLFSEPPLPFSPYRDTDYDEIAHLISRSFCPMRRELGIEPNCIPPSQEERDDFAAHCGDLFVLRQGGRIIGFASAMNGEIDSVCVDDMHRGQGLGAALVMRAANHILNSGHTAARLSVVDWNVGAYRLYRSLGFTKYTTTHIFRKTEEPLID